MLIICVGVVDRGNVHKFRMGLAGLLIPVTYLLMSTTDVAYALWHLDVSPSRSKALFAGTLASAVFNSVFLIIIGIRVRAQWRGTRP